MPGNNHGNGLLRWLTSAWPRRRRSPPEGHPCFAGLGAVTRAVAAGESLAAVLDCAARSLLVMARADRAGVWVLSPPAQPRGPVGALEGCVADAAGEPVPESWRRLDASVPTLAALVEAGGPVLFDVEKSSPGKGIEDWRAALAGPAQGMRAGIWLPLRLGGRALGLALAGYAGRRPLAERNQLDALSREICVALLALREREQQSLAGAQEQALEELRRAKLAGAPLDELLTRLTECAQRTLGAAFLGIASSGAEPFSFRAFSGTADPSALAAQPRAQQAWRRAAGQRVRVTLHLQTAAEAGAPSTRVKDTESALATLELVPLLVRDAELGMLAAGYPPGRRAAAATDAFATFAAEVLWQECTQKTLGRLKSSSRALLESYPDWLLSVDRRGRLRSASRAAREAMNLAPPQPLAEIFSAGERSRVQEWLQRAAHSPTGLAPLEAGLERGGKVRLSLWGETSTPPAAAAVPSQTGADDANERLLLLAEDLSTVDRAEQERTLISAELSSVLDSIDSGVVLYDAAGRIRYANARFAQLAGLDARQLADCSDFNALLRILSRSAGGGRPSEAFERRWRDAVAAATGDEAIWDEVELLPASGGRVVLERYVRPVLEPAAREIRTAQEKGAAEPEASARSRPLGWLEVYRDISAQRLITSKLLQTEKMAAVGQLVSGIAHELNNPLASIMGYAQLLLARIGENRPEFSALRAEAERIYQEAERSARIVKNLLVFAREKKAERRPLDLNEIVERTLALRSYELKIENISVQLRLDSGLPAVLGDAHQLQQALLNLIVNAEQAIQTLPLAGGAPGGPPEAPRGHIRIRTFLTEPAAAGRAAGRTNGGRRRVALEIADSGPGIPPETATRVFDPFFTTKPVGVGTGLGLSIVYGIVQEHGGEITVDAASEGGRGARFLIELPVAEEAAQKAAPQLDAGDAPSAPDAFAPAVPAAAGAAARSGAPAARRPPRRAERILVVEDEPTVAQLISDVLAEEGFHPEVVLDSLEGLSRLATAARERPYDLVVCDLRMPRMDGREFYQALARAGNPARDRIVFVTGDTLTPRTLEFLEKYGLPYVSKPFRVEELKLVVAQALAEKSANGKKRGKAGERAALPPRGRKAAPSKPADGKARAGSAIPDAGAPAPARQADEVKR